MMKKAFTLVELLVVVVVIAILASIAFRLTSVGTDTERRNITVARMQKLENAVSGYFAAYGSYPPVALQGRSRDYGHKTDSYGVQDSGSRSSIDIGTDDGWNRVKAACKAQPVAALYPISSEYSELVDTVSEAVVKLHDEGDSSYADEKFSRTFDVLKNYNTLLSRSENPEDNLSSSDWGCIQLFQFGLISYLVPRYLVMMGHGYVNGQSSGDDKSIYDDFDQWGDNNSMPCKFDDGTQYDDWEEVNQAVGSTQNNQRYLIALIPTQSVCARWLANLEGLIRFVVPPSGSVYGVSLSDGEMLMSVTSAAELPIYSQGGSGGGDGSAGGQQYVLNKATVIDGWGNDFYYCSMPPYQGYRIWSSGANGRTFPPWVPDEQIDKDSDLSSKKDTIRNWLADDIVHLSN